MQNITKFWKNSRFCNILQKSVKLYKILKKYKIMQNSDFFYKTLYFI